MHHAGLRSRSAQLCPLTKNSSVVIFDYMRRIFRGRFLIGLSVLFLSSVVSFSAVDVVIFHLFNKDVYRFEVGLFQKDPKKRYALTPNFSGFLYHRAGKTPVYINSRGYRGPEWRLDATYRFMILGDSMTFGVPLPYEQGFVAKAEAKTGGDTAFYNLGVPGYGTGHELQSLRENCKVISPREVFYMYFLNDLGDQNIRMDYFDIVDGYLVRTYDDRWRPRGIEKIREGLGKETTWSPRDTLRLINIRKFLSERGIHPTQLIGLSLGLDKGRYIQTGSDIYSAENVRKATDDILEMRDVAAACGAGFTMVILTSFNEDFYKVIEPATERLIHELDGRVRIMDIRKFTREGVNLTQWYDGHYGTAGTDLVSNVLASYILGLYPELTTRNR